MQYPTAAFSLLALGFQSLPSNLLLYFLPTKSLNLAGLVEEVLLEIGFDFHAPDVFQLAGDVGAHEEAGTELVMGITDLFVKAIQDADEGGGVVAGVAVVMAQQIVIGR